MADAAPMELDVVAVADAVEKATAATGAATGSGNAAVADDVPVAGPPPAPLPPGWLMKQSRSNPMYYYYYDMETGYTTWDPPVNPTRTMTTAAEVEEVLASLPVNTLQNGDQEQKQDGQPDENSASTTKDGTGDERTTKESSSSPSSSNKRRKTKKSPEQVRVLHILKKHKDSRRPSSWRQKKITQTREEAHEELKSLLELLEDDAEDAEALRATFEEIARTESDCTSAKRGGDLGFFTRGKMQKPFEDASFSLNKGELTKDIVDSSSGSHLILRIG